MFNYKLTYTVFICCFFAILSFSCKKTKQEQEQKKKQEPWTVEVVSITKLNLNMIDVKIAVTSDTSYSYDDWGILYSNTTIDSYGQRCVHVYSKGTLHGDSVATTTCHIDSLQGNTTYYIKAFVKKGGTFFYSKEKQVNISNLKILGFESSDADGFYADRGEQMQLRLNYNDSDIGVETKVFIDGIQTPVTSEWGQFINFTVPLNLSSGKKSIRIERNGLSLTIADTLEIRRGRYTIIGDFPYAYRCSFGWGQMGNTGYILGGWEYPTAGPYGWHKELLKYDIVSNRWSDDAAAFPKYFVGGIAFTLNGKLYGVSSRDVVGSIPSSRTYEYDPSLNKWTEKSYFPGFRLFSQGFVLNNKFYVLSGGGSDYPLHDLWQYDPLIDKWSRKADFPGEAMSEMAIFTHGGQAFVFGGATTSHTSREFWQYDAVKDEWTELEVLSDVKRRRNAIHFTMGSKGYLLAGCDHFLGVGGYYYGPVDDSWEIDLITKKWTRISASHLQLPSQSQFQYDYLQTASFLSGDKAIIYNSGKMIQFTLD